MKILISFLISYFILTSASFAQYDSKAKAILDAMSAKYKAMPAFSADFLYTLSNPDEDLDENFEGQISVKDDKYRLETESQMVINDGETVWTYLPEVNEVNISEYDPEEQEISLSNIFSLYQEGFKYLFLELSEDGTINVIDLVPEDKNLSYFKIRMRITNKNELKSFKIFDKNGNKYIYEVKNFEEMNNLENSYFTFDVAEYEDVEVIDFR